MSTRVSGILIRLGVYYFLIMGLILFLFEFVIPDFIPQSDRITNWIKDLIVVFLTPVITMVLLNRELNQINRIPEKTEILNKIIKDIEGLELNYGNEAFLKKKNQLIEDVKSLTYRN